jgi:hypothetical protein
MKRVFILFLLFAHLMLIGCAGSSQSLKSDRGVKDVLKFSLDLVSLGLLLGQGGSSAHIPSASLATVLDFGKAVDAVAGSVSSLEGVEPAKFLEAESRY